MSEAVWRREEWVQRLITAGLMLLAGSLVLVGLSMYS